MVKRNKINVFSVKLMLYVNVNRVFQLLNLIVKTTLNVRRNVLRHIKAFLWKYKSANKQ